VSKVNYESSALNTHLNILQGVITRMAQNSSNCKAWAITIVSAILVLAMDRENGNSYKVAYFPIILFYLLDCYYLGLEKHFRSQYNSVVLKLKNKTLDESDCFIISMADYDAFKQTMESVLSISTSPFYIIIIIMIMIISKLAY